MSAPGEGQTGLEILTEWKASGKAPGFAGLLGFSVADFGPGYAHLDCPIRPEHANLMKGVHGGVMAGLMDAVTGCALLTLLGPNERFATTDLQVRYLKGAPSDSVRLRAEADIVHRGRTLCVAETRVCSPDGTVHARGSASMMIRPVKRASEDG
ncbi:PaaI family thioesterase [Marinicauda sp. Alg238-R41]|uniref:PaaI family thioesterase n=1 Tax=Marinicauda sp. Alg238-R41 TaxID=2993447 RepID=UPI0022E96DCB|nr:PaaI family thioesterase [Marinicauda sp. Alg238-R41]